MQIHLATTLSLVSAQTVVRFATGADVGLANFYFKRRNERGNKLELADGTDILAETCPAKKRINDKSREKIVDDQPGRPNWLVPQAEDFIAPKEQHQQRNG